MKSDASSLNAVSLEMAGVAITPALEAETERLLSGRTRDIHFSSEMTHAYRQKHWPQRSKIARAWMAWVTPISIAFAREGAAPETVAKWADDSLYDAKRSGRNVVFLSTAHAAEEKHAAPAVAAQYRPFHYEFSEEHDLASPVSEAAL